MKLLVTGCFSFMAWEFTLRALKDGYEVVGIDSLLYPSINPYDDYLNKLDKKSPILDSFTFYEMDISDIDTIDQDTDYVINFAAESHVANSIESSEEFVMTNILGLTNILDSIKDIKESGKVAPRLIQISTDEVYGDISEGEFYEDSPLNPSNPYAASKASADLMILSYARTHGLEYNILRPTNNFGKFQWYEKLIPIVINNFLNSAPTSLHDGGRPVRTWTHVSDTASAIFCLMQKWSPNQVYNCSSGLEATNKEMCVRIMEEIDEQYSGSTQEDYEINFAYDLNRQGQDCRYALNCDKLKSKGWKPKTRKKFDKHIKKLVKSYVKIHEGK